MSKTRGEGRFYTFMAIWNNPAHRLKLLVFASAIFFIAVPRIIILADRVIETRKQLAVYNLGIDTITYKEIAGKVALEGIRAIPISQPPGYPLFLSVFSRFSKEPLLPVKIAQIVLLIGIALVTFFIGKKISSPLVGLMAALAILLSSPLEAYALTLQYEVLAAFFMAAAMLLAVTALPSGKDDSVRILPIGLTGFLFGLSALVREPNAIGFLAILISLFALRLPFRRRLLPIAIFAALFSMPVGGWIGYQYVTKGKVILISEKGDINFKIGNNPNANGSFNLVRSDLAEPQGLRFILERPSHAARIAGRKVLYLWGIMKDGWNVPRYSSVIFWHGSIGILPYRACLWLARSFSSILALLGICFVLFNRELRQKWWFAYGTLLFTTAFYSIFIGSFRFMVPLLPLIYLLASFAVTRVFKIVYRRARSRQVLSCVALLVVFAIITAFIEKHGSIILSGEDLDGMRIKDVLDTNSTPPRPVIYAPGQFGPRLIGIFPSEDYPSKSLEIITTVKRSGLEESKPLELILRTRNNKPTCRLMLQSRSVSSETYEDLPGSCTDARGPVSLELYSKSSMSYWLDSIKVQW